MTIEEIEVLPPGQVKSNETLRLWASFVGAIAMTTYGKVFRTLWADFKSDMPTGTDVQLLAHVVTRLQGLTDCVKFLQNITDYSIPASADFAESVVTRDVAFATRFYLGLTKSANQSLGEIRTMLRKDKDSQAYELLGTLPQIAQPTDVSQLKIA